MKIYKQLTILSVISYFISGCVGKPANVVDQSSTLPLVINTPRDRNNWWYCPDNIKGFPPVEIRSWYMVPVVNGRLPTKEETENGTSLIYYNKMNYPDAKPYNMSLPKLAAFFNPNTQKNDTVIVIQIVQTAYDTVVGYRYLTGGNGSYNFRDFYFLDENEVKRAVAR